jgi:4-diphosphocytidyl-2-C-methyl-D-erythritol kinase
MVAAQLSPSVDRLCQQLNRLDLLGHQMSGSGTSYFGLCRHARQARRIAELLQARGVGRAFHAASAGGGRDILATER